MNDKHIEKINKNKKIVDEMMFKIFSLHIATFDKPDLFNVWDESKNNENELFIRHHIHRYKLLYLSTKEMYEYINNPKNKDDHEYNYNTLKLLKVYSKKLYKILNGYKKGKYDIEKQGINKYLLIFCAKKIDK